MVSDTSTRQQMEDKATSIAQRRLLSVMSRASVATLIATAAAFGLFLISRAVLQVPYDWLNLAEVVLIPILVAFPIAGYIFYQADRLAEARVALAQQAKNSEIQTLLVNELNHRVKNTLVTVQSIAAQTFRGKQVDPEAHSAFEDRLLALSRTHDLLTREQWQAVSLIEVVDQALQAFRSGAGNTTRVSTSGEDIRLRPRAALAIGMTVHELAVNALKYGALSAVGGIVSLTWRLDAAGELLRIVWKESGGPPVAPPKRKGFGSRLIERGMAYEMNGTVSIEYLPTGVVCLIEIPSAEIRAE